MTAPIWLGLLVVGFVAAPSWLAIWSRRDTWARPAAVVLFIVAIPVVAYAGAETLGRHKPMSIAWDLGPGDHLVLAAKLVQDRAIYLYLDDETREEPRPLILPWDNQTADAIQKALDGAPEGMEGQFLLFYNPDGQTTEIEAHPLPHPPSPPAKNAPAPGLTYEQPQD